MRYNEGKKEKTTKVFDTFVHISEREPMLVAWDVALPTEQLAESSDAGLYATYSAGHHGGLRDQASGFDYESLGATYMGRARTRWRDETMADRHAVEGDKPDLSVGQRVFHQKFGYGRIVAVDGNKLDIEFEKAGPKKVLDSFIEAA